MARINQYATRLCITACMQLLLFCGFTSVLLAQSQAASASAASVTSDPVGFETLDRVVATVNGDMILDSDVDTEMRFQSVAVGCDDSPKAVPCAAQESRAQLTERLINQQLIIEQMQSEEHSLIDDDEVDAEIAALPSTIPACRPVRCKTSEDWSRFLQQRGFTVSSFREYWLQRQAILAFVEQRFRPGIAIDPKDVAKYYSAVLVPRYHAEGVSAPSLSAITPQIGNILVEQNISALLDDWLVTIRAQSHIEIFTTGMPSP